MNTQVRLLLDIKAIIEGFQYLSPMERLEAAKMIERIAKDLQYAINEAH
jgi:hypothetical protein